MQVTTSQHLPDGVFTRDNAGCGLGKTGSSDDPSFLPRRYRQVNGGIKVAGLAPDAATFRALFSAPVFCLQTAGLLWEFFRVTTINAQHRPIDG